MSFMYFPQDKFLEVELLDPGLQLFKVLMYITKDCKDYTSLY